LRPVRSDAAPAVSTKVDAATTAAGRLAAADADAADLAGYQTPATAFDPEFVLNLDGVEGFFDEELPAE